MRLVLDTNIVVSALLWSGEPYRLLDKVRRQADSVGLYASVPMLAELGQVLNRPSLARRLASISRTPAGVLADYATVVEIIEAAPLRGVAPDPDDDMVIATAVAARADLLVTGDRRLLEIREFGGVSIVSAADASARLPD